MDSAERFSVTGIVGGMHRHDDNSLVCSCALWWPLVLTFLRHVHVQSRAVRVTPQA